jgi:MOSC domain-containing protein YiiM
MGRTGKLQAIWLKRMKAGPTDPQPQAQLQAGSGLIGNANRGGKRQVTIIEEERWHEVMAMMGANLDPATRRANLMVSSIQLADSRGKLLKIGDCRIRIYGETKPCELMDKFLPGLQKAMRDNWSGGVFGEVLDDGEIKVGDPVQWTP